MCLYVGTHFTSDTEINLLSYLYETNEIIGSTSNQHFISFEAGTLQP